MLCAEGRWRRTQIIVGLRCPPPPLGDQTQAGPEKTIKMGRTGTRTLTPTTKPTVRISGHDGTKDGGEANSQGPAEDKLDKILQAIDHTRERLETKIDAVTVGLSLLRDDHRKLTDRVTLNERAIGELQPSLRVTHDQLAELTDRVRFLEGRAEDAEGRARRSNLRIVGLPEGAEGRDPLPYMEEWLKSFMPAGTLSPFYSIERAHRVPGRCPVPGAPPRPMLVKMLHFKVRDAILRVACSKSVLRVNDADVTIFPDSTMAVQQQRASFTGVTKTTTGGGT